MLYRDGTLYLPAENIAGYIPSLLSLFALTLMSLFSAFKVFIYLFLQNLNARQKVCENAQTLSGMLSSCYKCIITRIQK